MRRIKIVGLCLVAVFAMSAIVAGTASAAPEYWTTGKLSKKFEKNIDKIAFSSTGVPSKLEGGVVIECEKDTSKGTIENSTVTKKVKVTYTGCTAPSITSSCQKAPTKPGVIVTESLTAKLASASEEPGGAESVVNEFNPEVAGKPFAKFTCGPKKELSVIVTGHILAEQGPVEAGLSLKGFTINREKAAEKTFGCSKQQFLYLNGTGACQHLLTAAGVSWNISEDTVTTKKAVEIKK